MTRLVCPRSAALRLGLFVALAGCTSDAQFQDASSPPDSRSGSCRATDPRATPVALSVLPDDGEKPYVDLIGRAKLNLRVFAYLMGTGGILSGLKQRASSGVRVQVILEAGQSTNEKYATELRAAGAQVLWSDPKFPYMHAKVIIGDEREAVVSTGNYSLSSAIQRNRDFVVLTTDPQDLRDLVYVFDQDWNRAAVMIPCTRLLVSPNNARLRVLEHINSAQSSLLVESMQLADTEVRSAVAARKKAGVNVRVILASASWVTDNAEAAAVLKAEGIPVRWLGSPSIHTKAIVVDSKTAYAGSINFSYTSLSKNREVGLIFSDGAAVQRMTATFEKDWSKATSF